eukprot:2771085-Prorocentrum_lima.AAC.1
MPEVKEEQEAVGGATASTEPKEEEQEPLTGASNAKPEYAPPVKTEQDDRPSYPEGGVTAEQIDKLVSE